MTNIITSSDSNDGQSLTVFEQHKLNLEKERTESAIFNEELWKKNVNGSMDQDLLKDLVYKKERVGFEDVGGFWWHRSVNVITGFADPRGTIKLMGVAALNKTRRLTGGEEIGKYLNYPCKETITPSLAEIDGVTLRKISEFYRVPYETIYNPHRADLGLWEWVRDHCRRLMVTEGFKKELSVLDCGIVCISIPGVYNGLESKKAKKQRKEEAGVHVNKDRQGRIRKVRLSKALDQILCGCPKTIVLAFDMDLWQKHEVKVALERQARALIYAGHKVEVASWNKIAGSEDNSLRSDTAKGIDDLKVELGLKAVIHAFEHAKSWEDFQNELIQPSKYRFWGEQLSTKERILCMGNKSIWHYQRDLGVFEELENPTFVRRWVGDHLDATRDIVSDEESIEAGKTAWTPGNADGVFKYWVDKTQIKKASFNQAGYLPVQNGFLEIYGGQAVLHEYPDYSQDIDTEILFTYKCPVTWNLEEWPLDKCLEKLRPMLNCFANNTEALTFLMLMSCCLDIPGIRPRHTRIIKAIALLGSGSNGKDAWRDLFKTVFSGVGMTNFNLAAFKSHDKSSDKFPLYGIQHAKINWGSENAACNLEIQSLKEVITGETLKVSAKYKNSEDIVAQCINVFNQNDHSYLSSDRNASSSRWIFIDFPKTFVDNPNPDDPLEMQARPEFRDKGYIIKNFAPALLHALFWLYQDVWKNGIDTSCFDAKRKEIVRESNHLYEFINDALIAEKGSNILVSDILKRLIMGYLDDGLIIGDYPDYRSLDKGPDSPILDVNTLGRRLEKMELDVDGKKVKLKMGRDRNPRTRKQAKALIGFKLRAETQN